jgi:hypothetical protein
MDRHHGQNGNLHHHGAIPSDNFFSCCALGTIQKTWGSGIDHVLAYGGELITY